MSSRTERSAAPPSARGARRKLAVQRAAAKKAARGRRLLLAGSAIAIVVALVLVVVIVRPGSSSPTGPTAIGTAAQDAAVAREVSSVPASVFNSIGAGTSTGFDATSGQPLLTSAGKPEVLYMGGEFCPYCAAERWILAATMSRFGTFTGLGLIHSSPTDIYPSTPTLTFDGSSYTSKYLDFTPVEWYGEADGTILQTPTDQEAAIFNKYGDYAEPGDYGFPFVDLGNQYILPEPQYVPSALQGMTWSQVAAAMQDPTSAVAKDIDGGANIMTAAICKLTNGQPGGVCSSPGVEAAAKSL